MLNFARRLWQGGRSSTPIRTFSFDRPLVLLQSDDWGRIGVRDGEGFEQLRSAGLALGENPYDFYTLETAEDVAALSSLLQRHRDSIGRPACLEMNFIVANVDFPKSAASDFQEIHLKPLSDGLPGAWRRPGLFEAYKQGIADGVLQPALHGLTHFCRPAVLQRLQKNGERARLLRQLWQTETPYIHWRMPWIGYEYWNPELSPERRFLGLQAQQQLVRETIGVFARLFSTLPKSACAPGYRADQNTHCAWSECGIRVAQNGPGTFTPPHFDHHGVLQLHRSIEFEPAVDSSFSMDECLRAAEECFSRGIPAVVSVHSINFHSSLKDFRATTLTLLDRFLSALETKHPDLLYLHSADLYHIVNHGEYDSGLGKMAVSVKQQSLVRGAGA